MSSHNHRSLCLAYAAGPGDVVATFTDWRRGEDDPHQMAITYSGQFFEVCRQLKARGVAISSCPRADRVRTEQFYVENLPKGPASHGLGFHLQQIHYVRQVIRKAAAEGADLLIMADATGHFFPFRWFAPRRLALVPSLHCTLWPRFKPLSRVQKIINLLNREIFQGGAAGILCLSQDIQDQVRIISGNRPGPVFSFIPTYRKGVFDGLPEPPARPPFNLLYAGRLEKEKGVFELLQIAVDLKKSGNNGIFINLCGDGSQEAALRRAAAEKGIEDIFHIYGYCRRPLMLDHIGRSHAFIVPTTTAFGEGFNKVVAEGILAGRPVITSAVCPALEHVRDGVIEVPPDDWDGYRRAIVKLAGDHALYGDKRQACARLQQPFYDPARSWGAALMMIVARWQHD